MTPTSKFNQSLFLAVAVVFFIFPFLADAATLSLSPGSGSQTIGSVFAVNVLLDTAGAAIDGVDIRFLRFNPALLRVQDDNPAAAGIQIAPGGLMSNSVANSVDNAAGQIQFSQITGPGTTFTGTGILATVHFQVMAAGIAAVIFDFIPGSAIDSNVASAGADVLTGVTNGNYNLAASGIAVGSRVQARKNVYVRTAAGLTADVAGIQPQAALGTAVGGPILGNGFNWWNVDYDAGLDGWTAEDFLIAPVAGDVTPPTISITAPLNGAAVSGTIPISAAVSDNSAVAGVTFNVSGISAGTELAWPLYVIGGNTTFLANTTHTILAAARDLAGNRATSTPITVTVSNPPGTASTSTIVSSSGLAVYYNFDEGAGTVVNDSSGQLNSGAISGATWTTGRFGNALQFNGVGNLVTVNNSSSLDLIFGGTLEAWVFPTAATTDWRVVISKEMPANIGGLAYALYANSGAMLDHPINQPAGFIGTNIALYGTSQLPVNQWSHIAFTYDGQILKFYLNGILISASSIPGIFLPSSEPLTIGGSRIAAGQFFQGRIDEVRIYQRALTQAEIQADANLIGTPPPVATSTPPTATSTPPTATSTPPLATSTPPTATSTPPAVTAGGLCSFVSLGASTTDLVFPNAFFSLPSNGSLVSGAVNLSANATDNVKVAGVQFQRDCVNIGAEDLTLPYNLSWSSTSTTDGVHILSALARDTAGNRKTSPNAAVIVDNAAPLISGVLAVDVGGKTARVTWNTNEPATGQIEYGFTTVYNLFSPIKTPLVRSNSLTLTNLFGGRVYHYRIKSKDAAGNLSVSSDFTFTTPSAAAVPFTVSVGSPFDGSFVKKIVPISAVVSFGVVGVQFQLDGVNFGAEDIVVPFSVSWDTAAAANGLHLLSAVGRNSAGVLLNSPKIAVFVDNSVPVISGVSAAMISSDAAVISWATDEPADSQVEYGLLLSPILFSNFNPSLITGHAQVLNNLKPGAAYLFRVKSKDVVFNPAVSGTFTFTTVFDSVAPTVSIFTPANGAAVAGVVSVSAIAADNIGVAGVLFKANDQNILSEDFFSPYTVSWDTNRVNGGTYTLTAITRDISGNRMASTPISVTVQKSAKFFLGDRISVSGTVNVRSFPSTAGALLGTQTAGAAGTIIDGPAFANGFWWWRVNYDVNPDGWSVEDNLLRTASETVPPTVILFTPVAGAFLSSTTTISASASDNIKVAGVQFQLDSVNLGPEDQTAPYSFVWDTRSAADGIHTVAATARDPAGNTSVTPSRAITVDNTLPSISLVAAFANASGTTSAGVKVSWLTDEPASTQFDYGLTASYGSSSPLNLFMATSHTQTIQGFIPNTLYHYRVKSKDRAGNLTVSGDFIFTTSADAVPPKISGVTASAITNIFAAISWSTNEISDTQVEYGPTTAYGSLSSLVSAPVLFRNASLMDLTPGTVFHYRVKSKDPSGNLAVSGDFTFTTKAAAADLIEPKVSIITPSGFLPLRGTTTVTASAGDNIRVFGVQFRLDGVNLGSEDAIPPYSFVWDTAAVADGVHTLTAVARDTSGNTSSTAKTVTIDNTAPILFSVSAVPSLATIVSAKSVIAWLTNEPATTQVDYGLTESYGSSTPLDARLFTSHSQTILNLFPASLYHYRVKSKDKAGNAVMSFDFTFTTP